MSDALSREPKVGQVWQHFRTRDLYTVTGFSRDATDHAKRIEYAYDKDSVPWSRDLVEFLGTVEVTDPDVTADDPMCTKRINRFERVR